MKIAVLPGDGIGTEIVAEAVKVLRSLDLGFEMEQAAVWAALPMKRMAIPCLRPP
jgi:3-isopropylmalate dehydrogenase